ncbi:MAG TPA: hypothetical protein VIP54_03460 [Microterricola sp.]
MTQKDAIRHAQRALGQRAGGTIHHGWPIDQTILDKHGFDRISFKQSGSGASLVEEASGLVDMKTGSAPECAARQMAQNAAQTVP